MLALSCKQNYEKITKEKRFVFFFNGVKLMVEMEKNDNNANNAQLRGGGKSHVSQRVNYEIILK